MEKVQYYEAWPRIIKDGFNGQFFVFFEISFIYFVVAIYDLVYEMEAIHSLWKLLRLEIFSEL